MHAPVHAATIKIRTNLIDPIRLGDLNAPSSSKSVIIPMPSPSIGPMGFVMCFTDLKSTSISTHGTKINQVGGTVQDGAATCHIWHICDISGR